MKLKELKIQALHKKIAFAILMIAVIISGYIGSRELVRYRFENAMDNIQVSDSLIGTSKLANSAVFNCPTPCPSALELFELRNFIGYRSGYHIEIASKYYYNYHALSMMLIVCSVLLGLCTFILAKKGWDNETNSYLKIAFILSFFFSSVFGLFATTLRMEENFQLNTAKYNALTKIQLDIHAYLADVHCDSINPLGQIDCDSLHIISQSTRTRLAKEIDLIVDIDLEKIPTQILPQEK